MHARTFLHKLLSSVTHMSRLKLLTTMVEALIDVKTMTLTGMARGLNRSIQERSAIRTVDRFLGNKFFQNENAIIFKEIISFTIGNEMRPEIIVDWSKIPNNKTSVLRASFAATGRAITLYEEVHPEKKMGNVSVQNKFLKKLKNMLPLECKPIIVTDAGFKSSWFKEVLELGWDYIGRVRQLKQIEYSQDGKRFKKCKELTKIATFTPKSFGEIILSKTNPFVTYCYLVKKKIKGRKKRLKNGKIDKNRTSKQHSQGHREGWVIVSSLTPNKSTIAKKIMNIYSRRMTIEESFRDLKSTQYGFGMDQNKTIKQKRLIVWLLLAALACLLAWIVGYFAEKAGLHHQFQANSIKNRRVLSFFYLGCEVIRKKHKLLIAPSNIVFFEGAVA